MVDLSKPAFRLGVAEISVGTAAHELEVSVTADKPQLPGARQGAGHHHRSRCPTASPRPAPRWPSPRWTRRCWSCAQHQLGPAGRACCSARAWGVETATAQMEIIGRRHYGRKAVPAGGGGGASGTRELFDTLLLWNPRGGAGRQRRGRGRGAAERFADQLPHRGRGRCRRAGLFGTGSTSIRVTQDLQIISGLPPLVREGDRFRAHVHPAQHHAAGDEGAR